MPNHSAQYKLICLITDPTSRSRISFNYVVVVIVAAGRWCHSHGLHSVDRQHFWWRVVRCYLCRLTIFRVSAMALKTMQRNMKHENEYSSEVVVFQSLTFRRSIGGSTTAAAAADWKQICIFSIFVNGTRQKNDWMRKRATECWRYGEREIENLLVKWNNLIESHVISSIRTEKEMLKIILSARNRTHREIVLSNK